MVGQGELCTGTLIMPDLVLTARHCLTTDVQTGPIQCEGASASIRTQVVQPAETLVVSADSVGRSRLHLPRRGRVCSAYPARSRSRPAATTSWRPAGQGVDDRAHPAAPHLCANRGRSPRPGGIRRLGAQGSVQHWHAATSRRRRGDDARSGHAGHHAHLGRVRGRRGPLRRRQREPRARHERCRKRRA
jgi:hypothetical protein